MFREKLLKNSFQNPHQNPYILQIYNQHVLPQRLYKYLPYRYVGQVLNNGELLFRNLTYFQQYECEQRGDPLEGHHRDNPDNDIEITVLSTGEKIKGDYSFLNSTDAELIYVFCLSKTYSKELYEKFDSDACIEITDVEEFIRRVRIKIKQLISVHKNGLLHNDVKYYAANQPAEFNIKEPKEIAFAKDEAFRNQDEYRLVFGTKKAFKLEQKIVVNATYNFREEAMKGIPKDKLTKVGSISDIANEVIP